MKEDGRGAGRLGVWSLAKKTANLTRKFTGQTNHSQTDSEAWGSGTSPKLVCKSDSSDKLPSPNAYSASFEELWSGIELHRSVKQPECATNCQLQTNLFGKLPEEIREMIYQELWRDAGLSQHIIRTEAGYAHSRCLLHQLGIPGEHIDDEDPWESMWMVPDVRGTVPLWYRREMSTWCDHWKCEEAREEKEIWRDVSRGRTGRVGYLNTWTAFLPSMLTCKRMYFECTASIYKSVTFTITDIPTARSLFSLRYMAPASHPFRRVNLSFRRRVDEGSSFERWVESWTTILRLIDTPALESVNLWLDSDVFYERFWLSVVTNVFRQVPEALAHKVAVSLPPNGHRDRIVGTMWLKSLEKGPLATSRNEAEEGKVFRTCDG
ncbi:uncharacterized protein CTRU02_201280 [Colletotrichum truncatum]|uniref:Uncharacterized protein n=1 Tax=Colletotrichum truncatum TaxID=5467 RepID=A0ACC3ZGU5_COLTU|nr:uncharacterized protein CTRU02_08070 [Colletotrichum truncatum]KAF6790550.1 hypothetical protein CTRU02_08070 [Colletotrichum truncatum]